MTVNVLHRWLSLRVSIHTPIQGVTYRFMDNIYILHVSIHTPIQGVTSIAQKMMLSLISFNPHTHTGCDRRWAERSVLRGSFNPHTHTGCDISKAAVRLYLHCFNPHTHTGCDWILPFFVIAWSCFNPHTHTGCDAHGRETKTGRTWFQSTHPYRV